MSTTRPTTCTPRRWASPPTGATRHPSRLPISYEAGSIAMAAEALSASIRSGNDVLFYRHFHGPLFHYLLIPVSRLGLSERADPDRHARDSVCQPGGRLFRLLMAAPRCMLALAVPIQLFGDLVYRTGASSTVRAMLARESDSSFEGDRYRPATLLVRLGGGGWPGILHARSRVRAAAHSRHLLLRRTAPLARRWQVHCEIARAVSWRLFSSSGRPRFSGCHS